jgi:ABC-type multidrug transport system fused ATPase/permease subunit
VGLQYQVGTKGDNLSGGQKQKLAIGRTLIKHSPILIMDEATSGLDNKSQERIQSLLDDQLSGRSTVLAVIHRLDIINNFDKIAVMDHGRIIEMGTYHSLMEQQGKLFDLINTKNHQKQ